MNTIIINTQVLTPKTLTITAADAAALNTAINVQTNILNKTLRIPAQQSNTTAAPTQQVPNPVAGTITYYTSGNVENGSIVVTATRVYVANNVPTFYATVQWNEYVTPS